MPVVNVVQSFMLSFCLSLFHSKFFILLLTFAPSFENFFFPYYPPSRILPCVSSLFHFQSTFVKWSRCLLMVSVKFVVDEIQQRRESLLLSCIHFNLFLAMMANDWTDDDKHENGDKQTVSLCFCIFYKNH